MNLTRYKNWFRFKWGLIMNCKHCNIDESMVIFRGKFWTLTFSKQDYLGRCVLITNRHIKNY